MWTAGSAAELHCRPDLRQVPIVVCSVLNEPQLARFLGAGAYLRKPVLREDLLGTLEWLLGASSPAEQRRATP